MVLLLLSVRKQPLLARVVQDGGRVLRVRLRLGRGEVLLLQRRRRRKLGRRRTIRVDDGGRRSGTGEGDGRRRGRVVEEGRKQVRNAKGVGELDGALERDPASTLRVSLTREER